MTVNGALFAGLTTHVLADGSAGGMSTTQLVMLVAAVIVLTMIMRSTFRRVTHVSSQPRGNVRARYAQLQEENKTKRDVEQVMLELDRLARDIHGRIDTRFAKLEAVIRDADERIDRLSRLTRAAGGVPAFDGTVNGDDPQSASLHRQDAAKSRHAAIHRLADHGLSAVEIAKEVGQPTGEIELILSLRKTKEQAKDSAKVIS